MKIGHSSADTGHIPPGLRGGEFLAQRKELLQGFFIGFPGLLQAALLSVHIPYVLMAPGYVAPEGLLLLPFPRCLFG